MLLKLGCYWLNDSLYVIQLCTLHVTYTWTSFFFSPPKSIRHSTFKFIRTSGYIFWRFSGYIFWRRLCFVYLLRHLTGHKCCWGQISKKDVNMYQACVKCRKLFRSESKMRSSHPTKRTFPCPTFIVHRNKEVNVVEKKRCWTKSH